MRNEDLPAYPADVFIEGKDTSLQKPLGLTKLEYAAIMAMQGILANISNDRMSASSVAYDAVACAKELLNQLEEK